MIKKQVQQEFSDDVALARVKAEYKSVTTLSGTAPSRAAREQAVALAEGTPGVTRVDDRIALAEWHFRLNRS